jgi:hypothetical protein
MQPAALHHGRSQKRGGNYGTLDATTGQSRANKAVIAALNAGKAAGSAAAMKAEYDKIVAEYKVTYAQATLRYANLVDKALATSTSLFDKHAEGAAFSRCILPWVKAANTTAALLIEDVYDVTKTPQSANNFLYCATKQALASLNIPAADMGDLDLATSTTSWTGATIECGTASVAGFKIEAIVTPAGTYTPTTNVGGSLAYANAVLAVSGKVSAAAGNPGATTYEALYKSFINSGLKGIADKARASSPDQSTFATAFGSAKWLSENFEKTTGKASPWSPTIAVKDASARAEIQKKSVQDNIAVMAILDDLFSATQTDDATLRTNLWDHGAAKFMSTAHNADSKYTVYERADKRGGNYATKSADGKYANANKKIVDALNAGNAGSKATMATQLIVIRNQIKVIYTQAALRYAWKVNADLAEGDAYMEHLGEGMIFWLNIAPYVKASDAAGYALVDAFYQADFVAPPESFNYHSYCALKAVLEKFLDGISLKADLGTLESTSAAWCQINTTTTVLPSALSMIVSKAGNYTPSTDVGSSLALSDGVAAVKVVINNIESGASKYDDVEAAYEATGIKGHADTKKVGETVWDMFAASVIMGKSATWVSDLLTKAFVGTAPGFTVVSARAEVMEKTAMDAASVQLILSDLSNGAKGTSADHRLFWDRAAAKYLGSAANGRGATVYARANKRGANYGTTDATSGDAKANHAVVAALTAGAGATSIAARKAEYDKVETQIKVIYSQATLRYAFKIDNDVTGSTPFAEHQAEGYAFWRVIAPFVEKTDSVGATYVEGILNPKHTPVGSDHYCLVKLVLDKQNLAAADFGTLEGTSAVDCSSAKLPTTAAGVATLLAASPSTPPPPSTPSIPSTPGTPTVTSGVSMPKAVTCFMGAVVAIVCVLL